MASVLIVEDDKKALDILVLLVQKKYGFTVHRAEDGRQGLEIFQSFVPDLVVTDINMPVMDGIDMARGIRTFKDDAKFIVLTAYSDGDYKERFGDIGYCGFLLKPIEFTKLFACIEQCLGLTSSPINNTQRVL